MSIDHTLARVTHGRMTLIEILDDGTEQPGEIIGASVVAHYDYRRSGEMRTRWLLETASRWIVIATREGGVTSGAYVSTPKDRPHHVPAVFAGQAREAGARVTWIPQSKATDEATDVVPPAKGVSSVAFGGDPDGVQSDTCNRSVASGGGSR